MAKVVLYTIQDVGAAGIRLLGACLKQAGHQIILAMVERSGWRNATADIPAHALDNPGGMAASNVSLTSGRFLFPVEDNSWQRVPQAFLRRLAAWQPDIVGFSGRGRLSIVCPDWFRRIRQTLPDTFIFAGGFGPTVSPEFYIEAGADLVVRGEGEETLLELAACVDARQSWTHIRNVSWRDGVDVVHNPLRPLNKNLSSLPQQLMYEPGIFYFEGETVYERDPMLDEIQLYVSGGRGCIASCSYCASCAWQKTYGQQGLPAAKYRKRATNHLLDEIRVLKRHGVKFIRLSDDYFVRSPGEMEEFMDRYRQEINLPFWACFPSVFLLKHPDILLKAIDAGLDVGRFAVQTGDEEFAASIFTRDNNNRELHALAEFFSTHSLPIVFDMIDGYSLPGNDDLEAKLLFIKNMPAFNPAFPDALRLNVSYLREEANAPLTRTHPEIFANPLPLRDFIYRGMLMHFRLILNDNEFAALRANPRYRDNPTPLLPLFHALTHARHNAYVLEQAAKLAGREVYFWGCGELYQSRKHLFFGARPKAILVNVPVSQREVDGLAVLDGEKILRLGETLPIVVFSNQAHRVARRIRRLRPDYPAEQIISCTTAM